MTVRSAKASGLPPATLTPIGDLLFSASEPGAWYDPSDLTTLFQDSAGTVPVTAVEQPVGRMLDKSGRGNHATQATTTKRPVLSRRVNLLTNTENMVPTFVSGTAWTRGAFGNWAIPSNLGAQLAPDGTMNAVGIKTVGTGGITTLVHRAAVLPSTTYRFTVQVRKIEGEDQSGLNNLRLVFQTGNNGALVSEAAASVVIGTSVSDSWQQFEISYTTPATGVNQVEAGVWFSSAASAAVAVWGGSLTLATDAHLPYQWVNTATDYDADPNKFPTYIRFDGVDDAYQTNSINFTGTDKMTVWAGVTKLSDAAAGILLEHSANWNISNGTFVVAAPGSPGDFQLGSCGTVQVIVMRPGFAAPISAVFSMAANIAGPSLATRVNGVTGTTDTVSQGTGNYGNYPMYIGGRAGASLFFNGRLYGLIVRGAQSSQSQIEATELYVKRKMRLP